MAAAVVALAVILLGGCGDGPGPMATSDLDERVAAVRLAAERGDAEGARESLAVLVAEVGRRAEAGTIDADRAGAILAAAKEVEDDLALLDGSTTTTTTRRTTTTTTTAPTTTATTKPPKGDDHEDGGGKRKGKGKRHDD